MSLPLKESWSLVHKAEQNVLSAIASKEHTYDDVDKRLFEFRTLSLNLIFQDFEFATQKKVETRLWDAHAAINQSFRKHLSRFRDAEEKKKVVEKRKLVKRYLLFIKSSQIFYRGYIQRLSSHFGGLPEIEKIAKKFSIDNQSADVPVEVGLECQELIRRSCHQTLIRLGDLSRYRETETATKQRNWAPSIGYYDLAQQVYPRSGHSHNQLAVIALVDSNHLRALYHLYRALSVPEPYPSSKGNLELEFKKILSAQNKGKLIDNRDSATPGTALVAWFMCLHARCYAGIGFSQHDELENEVLSQLAVDLKERSLEGIPLRLTVINIAAQYLAKERFTAESATKETMQSLGFYFRLNIKTFFTLLRILESELERSPAEDVEVDGDVMIPPDGSERITAVMRRTLPCLRHYSRWLLTSYNLQLLNNPAAFDDPSLPVQIKQLWQIYARVLTLLVEIYPMGRIQPVGYLLEEDEDTIGFMPFFDDEDARKRYFTPGGQIKPHGLDRGIERSHPNSEMLSRIDNFVDDATELTPKPEIPLEVVRIRGSGGRAKSEVRFFFKEEGVPSEGLAQAPNGHHHSLSSTTVEHMDIQEATQALSRQEDAESTLDDKQSTSASVSANTEMNQMVDNLLDSEPTGSALGAGVIPAQFDWPASSPPENDLEEDEIYQTPQPRPTQYVTASDLVQQMMRTPSANGNPSYQPPRPILPSLMNSPFALQPGEQSPQSRPATAGRVSSPQGAGTARSHPMSASNSRLGYDGYSEQLMQNPDLNHTYNENRQSQQFSSSGTYSNHWQSPDGQNMGNWGPGSRSALHSHHNSAGNGNGFHGGFGSGNTYYSSPITSRGYNSSQSFTEETKPRNFGAIGSAMPGRLAVLNDNLTPPSAQGG